MADSRPALTCPACFAREVDPVFLHRDRETGEYYCTKCTYIAADAKTVGRFFDDFVKHRHGIERREPV
jgi:hypothetical protein